MDWVKVRRFWRIGVIAGASILAISILPSMIAIMVIAGILIGGVWIYMILKPLGRKKLMWLALHPKTFLILHLPITAGMAMLGDGLIMAMGNLLGGTIATIWVVNWGKKNGAPEIAKRKEMMKRKKRMMKEGVKGSLRSPQKKVVKSTRKVERKERK